MDEKQVYCTSCSGKAIGSCIVVVILTALGTLFVSWMLFGRH